MEFELTQEREAYLNSRGKVVFNACPGSGKTTAIAKKLIILNEEYKSKLGKYSGIACLSFTNTAKDEIIQKYTELSGDSIGFPHKISTIDSFINQYVTLPFYYLLNRDFKRPKIVDDNKVLDAMWQIQYTDKHGKLKDGLNTSLLRFKAIDGRNMFYTYSPSEIRLEMNGNFSVSGNAPSPAKVDLNLFKEYAQHLFQTRFKKGIISTQDSAFIAHYLLGKHSRIGEMLNLRFPHIIVDEAQDNSALQHALFEKLVAAGLHNIEFIGDPYQSLYEWRDANPQLFIDKYNDKGNWQGLDLTDNRRSPQRIIDCFSLLRKHGDPSINSTSETDKEIPITIYRYSDSNTNKIIQHYDRLCQLNTLRENQIVVRGNTLKYQMLGKGADVKPWKTDLPFKMVFARHLYERNEIKEAVKLMRSIAISLVGEGKEYIELKELENNLKTDHRFNALLLEIINDIPSFNLSISDWTTQTQFYLKAKLDLAKDVSFDMKNRNSKYFDKSILSEPLELHFKPPYSDSKISITTVHQAKGKTLDSVLIFFDKAKHPNNITFSDIEESQQTFPSEKQRIIYVAMSRPRHLLAMAFPDNISDDVLFAKFGNEIKIITEEELNDETTNSQQTI